MNYSTLRTIFYDLLGGESYVSSYVSNDVADTFALQAVRRMVEQTDCLERRTVKAVTAGTSEYSLPTDCNQVLRVTFDDERLRPITKNLLRNTNPRWRDHSGTPRFYYLDEMVAQIGLYENPSSGSAYASMSGPLYGGLVDTTAGVGGPDYGGIVDIRDMEAGGPLYGGVVEVLSGNGLEIIYRSDPGDDIEPMNIPAWAHPGVLYYMLWQTYRSDTLLQNQEQAEFWQMMYDGVLGRLRRRSRGKLDRNWSQEMFGGSPNRQGIPIMPEHIPAPD